MIIAVDGPTASGKGTLAKALAAHFGLPFLDTGLLYRAVGRHVQLRKGNPDDPADALAGCGFPESILDDPVLRNEEVGGLASRVSIHPDVRAALNKRQVDFANQPGGHCLTAAISARSLRRMLR
jgi:cytidylate kinase